MEKTDNLDTTGIPMLLETAKFETRKVEFTSNDSITIKPTWLSLAYSLIFITLGAVLASLWIAKKFTEFGGPGSVPVLLLGILFAVAGLGIYYSNNEHVLINKKDGFFYAKSWWPSVTVLNSSQAKRVQATDVVSVQSIARDVKHRTNRNRRRSTYTEYQVNVYVGDRLRHNVFVTLREQKANALAEKLVEFFGVPRLTE